jgi:hypothetical protein
MKFLLFASAFLLACSSSGDDSSTIDGGADSSGDGTFVGDVATKDAPAAETGPTLCNGVTCGANTACFQSTSCVCADGFVPNGTDCVAAPSGSPASHAQTDVCARWKAGHVVTTPSPYTAGANKCDPGTLSAGGDTDTLVRMNAYRWLVGAGDTVTDDPTKDTGDQACAIIAIWNPASAQAHNPPSNSVCYSALGATWAGQSNISWGSTSADSIDQYVQDTGNDATLGHRRWVLHPPLGVIGIGWVQASGTQYGSAGCLGVFDTSSTGPKPSWYSWPPEGYFPSTTAAWQWSFHYPAGMTSATATVMDMATGKNVNVTTLLLPSGYGDDTLEITPGFTPAANDIYRVTVTPGGKTPIVYEVRPVSCP